MWLCKVAERQRLRPSFVPPWPIRRLRDLTRYRTDLVSARTAEKNRVEKLLEYACIKLSVVASHIFGVSGRAMLAALVGGERDPKVLAQLARARMRGKIDRLEQAFDGHFADHHGFLLSRMSPRIKALDADIAAVDAKIVAQLASFAEAAAHLDEIPRHRSGRRSRHHRRGRGRYVAVPDRRAPVLVGEVRPGHQLLGRQVQGSASSGHGNP
jgi:transposase